VIKFYAAGRGAFILNEDVKSGYPVKIFMLMLLARLAYKRLQIGIDMLHIITSTGDQLFKCIDNNDLK